MLQFNFDMPSLCSIRSALIDELFRMKPWLINLVKCHCTQTKCGHLRQHARTAGQTREGSWLGATESPASWRNMGLEFLRVEGPQH